MGFPGKRFHAAGNVVIGGLQGSLLHGMVVNPHRAGAAAVNLLANQRAAGDIAAVNGGRGNIRDDFAQAPRLVIRGGAARLKFSALVAGSGIQLYRLVADGVGGSYVIRGKSHIATKPHRIKHIGGVMPYGGDEIITHGGGVPSVRLAFKADHFMGQLLVRLAARVGNNHPVSMKMLKQRVGGSCGVTPHILAEIRISLERSILVHDAAQGNGPKRKTRNGKNANKPTEQLQR